MVQTAANYTTLEQLAALNITLDQLLEPTVCGLENRRGATESSVAKLVPFCRIGVRSQGSPTQGMLFHKGEKDRHEEQNGLFAGGHEFTRVKLFEL